MRTMRCRFFFGIWRQAHGPAAKKKPVRVHASVCRTGLDPGGRYFASFPGSAYRLGGNAKRPGKFGIAHNFKGLHKPLQCIFEISFFRHDVCDGIQRQAASKPFFFPC